jgi:hypothetical protein
VNLERRISELERAAGLDRCPVCGSGGDLGDVGNVQFILHTTDAPGPSSPPCPACGQTPVAFTLNIGAPRNGGHDAA